jgi:hypothetical protein
VKSSRLELRLKNGEMYLKEQNEVQGDESGKSP